CLGLSARDHLLFPAPALGVFAVHAVEVGGEERRLLAAHPTADLHDHVLVVVGVARQEELLELSGQRGLSRLQLRQLGAGQLGQLLVAGGDRGPIVCERLLHAPVVVGGLHGAREPRALAREVAQLSRVARHVRIGEQPVQLGEARLHAAQGLLERDVDHWTKLTSLAPPERRADSIARSPITFCREAIATAHISRSGSRVVRRWNCMPGQASARTSGRSKCLPESRMNSKATPAMSGMHATRSRCWARFAGFPMNVNTTMLTITTRNRNVVPQRGWSGGK